MEHERELREFLVTTTNSFGFTLHEQQVEQFLFFLAQLLKWNRTINLTRITDPHEVITKHFVDSLAALAAVDFPLKGTVIDIGSGAGFPGIPLKLVRSDLHLLLIEPSQKKSSFLLAVVGALKLDNVSVFSGMIEKYAREPSDFADIVVIRALRFDQIAKSVAQVLKPTGKVVLYGAQNDQEEKAFPDTLIMESQRNISLPMNHGSRVLTVLGKRNAN